VHTGFGLCALAAGGSLDTHVHSFEELFYILEGSPILILDGHAVELAPGACGVAPVGVAHAWRGPATGSARWIDMRTPIPRLEGEPFDTFFLGKAPQIAGQKLDIHDPRNRHLFVLVIVRRFGDDDPAEDEIALAPRCEDNLDVMFAG
jgi:hypothetical protein